MVLAHGVLVQGFLWGVGIFWFFALLCHSKILLVFFLSGPCPWSGHIVDLTVVVATMFSDCAVPVVWPS